MKKLLGMILVLVIIGSFTACNNGGSEEQGETETATTTTNETDSESKEGASSEEVAVSDLAGETVTIGRWGGNDAETAAFNEMLAGFTAATGIEVEERIYSDINQELQAELIGGTAPDAFYLDGYMAPFYVQQGITLPLDPDEFEIDKFYTSLADTFKFDGEYHAISKDFSTLALYYNKAWISEDEIPTTYEELVSEDFLASIQADLPEDVIALTYNQDLARNMFLAQNGGADITKDEIYSNLGSEEVVANLTPLFEAAIAERIKTPADLGLGWNGDAFGNQKTAMMIEGNWSLGFLESNFPEVDFGVVEIPAYKGEKGTMVFNVGWAINAGSENTDVAKAFVKYATGSEGMAIWSDGAGVLPSRSDVAEATGVAGQELKIAHLAGAEYATPWQKGTTMDTINAEYRNYIPSVVKGERSLEEGLTMADDEANSTIEANQ